MDPWTILAGLIVVMLLFVALPIGAGAFTYWRRPRRVTCPHMKKEAQIAADPKAAAAAAVVGGRLGLERCSLWSDEFRDCDQACLKA